MGLNTDDFMGSDLCVHVLLQRVCWLAEDKLRYNIYTDTGSSMAWMLCCVVCAIYSPVIRLSKSYVFFGMCTADIIYKEEREKSEYHENESTQEGK